MMLVCSSAGVWPWGIWMMWGCVAIGHMDDVGVWFWGA